MAGKNDVEIVLKARDAMSQGLDSARSSLRRFGQDAERAVGTSFVERTGKALMGIQGIAGGLALAGGALKAFNGDSDALVDAMERLPLGLGRVVTELKNIINELAGFNEEVERTKKATEFTERFQKLIAERNNRGASSDELKIREINERAADAANKEGPELEAALAKISTLEKEIAALEKRKRSAGSGPRGLLEEDIAEATQRLQILRDDANRRRSLQQQIRQLADEDIKRVGLDNRLDNILGAFFGAIESELEAAQKAVDTDLVYFFSQLEREAADNEKVDVALDDFFTGVADALKQSEMAAVEAAEVSLRRKLAGAAAAAGVPSLFAEDRAQAAIEADERAIEEARRALRSGGGGTSLPAGDQSRFLTGVAQAGQSRLEQMNQKELESAQRREKLLEAIRHDLKEGQAQNSGAQINLIGGGVFGGLG